jgi:hypothetical protein
MIDGGFCPPNGPQKRSEKVYNLRGISANFENIMKCHDIGRLVKNASKRMPSYPRMRQATSKPKENIDGNWMYTVSASADCSRSCLSWVSTGGYYHIYLLFYYTTDYLICSGRYISLERLGALLHGSSRLN